MRQGYSCVVKYIDDAEFVELTFQKQDKGHDLLRQACDRLNLVETDYFGLRYVDRTGQRHWINATKPLVRQLQNGEPPYVLCFRVKFYPEDLTLVQEEITRYQLYLQVKRDLRHGRLLCSRSEAALLSGYILHATLGPHSDDLGEGYSEGVALAAAYRDKDFYQLAERYHKKDHMTDLSTSGAERSFLAYASSLPTYGVDPYPCRSDKGVALHFSFTSKGVVIFEKNELSRLFEWPKIQRITVDDRNVKLVVHEGLTDSKYIFNMGTEPNAKHVWKTVVEHMVFFNRRAENASKRIRSSRSLLRRASTVKFAGRTASELRYSSLSRIQPDFERTSSVRESRRLREMSLNRRTSRMSESIDSASSYTGTPQSTIERNSRTANGLSPPHLTTFRSQSLQRLDNSVDSGISSLNSRTNDDIKVKASPRVKEEEDWVSAKQHAASLLQAHPHNPGSTRQVFSNRDSTLDITENFVNNYPRLSQPARVISRQGSEAGSSFEDINGGQFEMKKTARANESPSRASDDSPQRKEAALAPNVAEEKQLKKYPDPIITVLHNGQRNGKSVYEQLADKPVGHGKNSLTPRQTEPSPVRIKPTTPPRSQNHVPSRSTPPPKTVVSEPEIKAPKVSSVLKSPPTNFAGSSSQSVQQIIPESENADTSRRGPKKKSIQDRMREFLYFALGILSGVFFLTMAIAESGARSEDQPFSLVHWIGSLSSFESLRTVIYDPVKSFFTDYVALLFQT